MKLFVGAYDFLKDGDNILMFKFKGSRKANHVKITLNSMDTYDIEFMTVAKITEENTKKWLNLNEEEFEQKMKKNKKQFAGVYCDQLIDIFESHTGLFLHF